MTILQAVALLTILSLVTGTLGVVTAERGWRWVAWPLLAVSFLTYPALIISGIIIVLGNIGHP